MLSRIKYSASGALSPKVYWYLMGKLRPVRAVTSEFATVESSVGSGAEVVQLLNRLGVIHRDLVSLHIGSGLGRVEFHLHSRVKRCHGIDVSRSMVQRAKRLVPFDSVEFHCTDGRDLSDWPDGSFGLIYSFLVFQHLPRSQFQRYVEEAHAKLSDKGSFVFQIMVDDTSAHVEPPASHPYGLRYYTRWEVTNALERTGFGDVSRYDLHGSPDSGEQAVGDVVFMARKR